MSHIRSSKYGFPTRSGNPVRAVEVHLPLLGIDAGKPAQRIDPNFAVSCRNVIADNGVMRPRSGLSLWGDTGVDMVLGATEMVDREGYTYVIAAGPRHIAVKSAHNPSWTTLVPSSAGTFGNLSAVSSQYYWDMTWQYSPGDNQNLAVLVNGIDTPKAFVVEPGVAAYSDFTVASAFVDVARTVVVADERLVMANVDGPDGVRPQRIVWSIRGNPKDWTLALGAGFRDLVDLRGQITRIVEEGDGFVIFTDHEIWRGRPRRDSFAFDFFALTQEISCPFPNSVVKTPFGVVFLGQDHDVYVVQGNNITSLGKIPGQQGSESRIKNLLRSRLQNGTFAFSTYDRTHQRYQLYYSNNIADYPQDALWYDFDSAAWWEQKVPWESSYAIDAVDPGSFSTTNPATWDAQTLSWNSMSGVWNDVGLVRPPAEARDVTLFASTGTAYRFRSEHTIDDTTNIECAYKAGGLNGRNDLPSFFDQIESVWVEYKSGSASNITLRTGAHPSAQTLPNETQYSVVSSELSYLHIPLHIAGRSPQFELAYTVTATAPGPHISALEVVTMRRSRLRGGR